MSSVSSMSPTKVKQAFPKPRFFKFWAVIAKCNEMFKWLASFFKRKRIFFLSKLLYSLSRRRSSLSSVRTKTQPAFEGSSLCFLCEPNVESKSKGKSPTPTSNGAFLSCFINDLRFLVALSSSVTNEFISLSTEMYSSQSFWSLFNSSNSSKYCAGFATNSW